MQDELDSANAHLSADYFFPKDAPGHKGVTAIALRDRATKFLTGHVVEQKGAGQQGAVNQLLKDLRKMGYYDKVVIRTDQEASIVDLFKQVAKDRGASKTILETAPRSDSKANGEAENAVQSVEQMVRTLMVDLTERCGEKLSVEDAFFAWLVEHACDLINRFKVRKGGKTAWEQLKSGPFSGDIFHFGAPVWHRTSGPVQGGVVQERWHDGIWLGLHFTSGEHLVAQADGIVIRARAVTPKPDSAQATKDSLVNIKTRPWESTGVITQNAPGIPPKTKDPPSGPSPTDPVPRGLRITRDILERYSLTKRMLKV